MVRVTFEQANNNLRNLIEAALSGEDVYIEENGQTIQLTPIKLPQNKEVDRNTLRGTVLKYIDPFEPVALDDWEVYKDDHS